MAQISRRAVLLGVVGVGLAACSKSSAQQSVPSTPPSTPSFLPSATPSPFLPVDTRPRWPLTGKLLKKEDKARHAAVAVKVPDNRREHPQRGIDKADIVFVQLEGYRDVSGYNAARSGLPLPHGRRRRASAFHSASRHPAAQPDPRTDRQHRRRALGSQLRQALSRPPRRSAVLHEHPPHRLVRHRCVAGIHPERDKAVICHAAILARQTKRFRSGPPQPYFPFASTRKEVSTRQGKRARSIKIPYKGDSYFMGYEYDKEKKRYLRSMPWGPHVVADGTRVSTDNVLVIKAKQHYGKIFRGSGHDEPLHDIIKTRGKFYYFNRGRRVIGTWSKGKVQEPFEFTLKDGSPLKMAPGQTFVELPDVGARLRIEARSRST